MTPLEHEITFDSKKGYAKLRIEKEKYITYIKTIDQSKNSSKPYEVSANLEPKVHEESIIINSDPSNADVSLNDEYLGSTPCEIYIDDKDFDVRRLLKISKRGYEPRLIRVKYRGEDYTDDNFLDQVKVTLEPIQRYDDIRSLSSESAPAQQQQQQQGPAQMMGPTIVIPGGATQQIGPGPVQQKSDTGGK